MYSVFCLCGLLFISPLNGYNNYAWTWRVVLTRYELGELLMILLIRIVRLIYILDNVTFPYATLWKIYETYTYNRRLCPFFYLITPYNIDSTPTCYLAKFNHAFCDINKQTDCSVQLRYQGSKTQFPSPASPEIRSYSFVKCARFCIIDGPLSRYVKLRVVHAGNVIPATDFKGNR